MSLKWYRRPRLVVLNSRSPVLDAARAIESNEIGAVIVQDKGRVTGIVTDRDLTVRVLGRGLDPKTTLLNEIMTTPVWTLSLAHSQADAVRLMQERNVRRIPLLEGERLAGIVTLDDLLLDETAPLDQLAAVVETQIGAGGPAPSVRSPAMERRAGRAEATYRRLLNQLRTNAALESAEEAKTVLVTVLNSLMRRLTPEEAKDTIAQLPSLMQPALYALPPGPDKLITRQTIEEEIVRELGVNRARAAELLEATGATISQVVSAGQMKDIQSQLPQELRGIFSEPRASAA